MVRLVGMRKFSKKAIETAGVAGKTAILIAVLATVACSSIPESRIGALDPRLGWPCDRLVVEWEAAVDRLQPAVGEALVVREIEGAGRLQLQVMHCEPERQAGKDVRELSYAYVLVPVSSDSAPIAITRVPSHGWFSLHKLIANEESQAILADFGYAVIPANVDFAVGEEDGDPRMAIELRFDTGSISIAAQATGRSSAEDSATVIVGHGDGFMSAYFGTEESTVFTGSATVRLLGQTPLTQFNLGATPAAVKLHRRLVSDRVYWRVPTG